MTDDFPCCTPIAHPVLDADRFASAIARLEAARIELARPEITNAARVLAGTIDAQIAILRHGADRADAKIAHGGLPRAVFSNERDAVRLADSILDADFKVDLVDPFGREMPNVRISVAHLLKGKVFSHAAALPDHYVDPGVSASLLEHALTRMSSELVAYYSRETRPRRGQ